MSPRLTIVKRTPIDVADLRDHAEHARDVLIDALARANDAHLVGMIGDALVEVHAVVRKLREAQP